MRPPLSSISCFVSASAPLIRRFRPGPHGNHRNRTTAGGAPARVLPAHRAHLLQELLGPRRGARARAGLERADRCADAVLSAFGNPSRPAVCAALLESHQRSSFASAALASRIFRVPSSPPGSQSAGPPGSSCSTRASRWRCDFRSACAPHQRRCWCHRSCCRRRYPAAAEEPQSVLHSGQVTGFASHSFPFMAQDFLTPRAAGAQFWEPDAADKSLYLSADTIPAWKALYESVNNGALGTRLVVSACPLDFSHSDDRTRAVVGTKSRELLTFALLSPRCCGVRRTQARAPSASSRTPPPSAGCRRSSGRTTASSTVRRPAGAFSYAACGAACLSRGEEMAHGRPREGDLSCVW